jgi:hypothetical protein
LTCTIGAATRNQKFGHPKFGGNRNSPEIRSEIRLRKTNGKRNSRNSAEINSAEADQKSKPPEIRPEINFRKFQKSEIPASRVEKRF